MAESQVSAVTYFETLGRRGIMQGEHAPLLPDKFSTVKGMKFPVYWVLYSLLQDKDIQLRQTTSSHPHRLDGLAWETGDKKYIFLANYQPDIVKVKLPNSFLRHEQKVLNEDSFKMLALNFDQFVAAPWSEGDPMPVLSPYSVLLLRAK